MMNPYESADRQLQKILKWQKSQFNRHRLRNFLSFDEVNVLRLKRQSQALYKRLDKRNREFLLQIAVEAYETACEEISAALMDPPNEAWLLAILEVSDPVTEYIYTEEVPRKRARFYETLLALIAMRRTTTETEKTYKRARDLWGRQTEQYEINVVDMARRKAFEDNGISQFMWNTQEDEKVCSVCRPRDGVIYAAGNIPTRHYLCRCWLTPI